MQSYLKNGSTSWWNKPQISEKEFIDRALSGDLILFKSKNSLGPALLRGFTASKFDHVALLGRKSELDKRDTIQSINEKTEIKYTTDDIFMLEALGEDGVVCTEWKTFRDNSFENLYSKVILRRLKFDNNKKVLISNTHPNSNSGKNEKFQSKTLFEFVAKVRNHPFELSPSKLFSKQISNIQDEIQEGRGFLCSELVAAAYRRLGLISKTKSSQSFLPDDFRQKKLSVLEEELELKGARLDIELYINCNLHEGDVYYK